MKHYCTYKIALRSVVPIQVVVHGVLPMNTLLYCSITLLALSLLARWGERQLKAAEMAAELCTTYEDLQ